MRCVAHIVLYYTLKWVVAVRIDSATATSTSAGGERVVHLGARQRNPIKMILAGWWMVSGVSAQFTLIIVCYYHAHTFAHAHTHTLSQRADKKLISIEHFRGGGEGGLIMCIQCTALCTITFASAREQRKRIEMID